MVPAGRARFARCAGRRVAGLAAPGARWRGRGPGSGDHREAEHPHERLDGVGGRLPPPVALPAVSVHRARRAAPLLDSPIQNHAPSPRGGLTRLEILGEIRHGAADDHQVAGRGTQAGSGRRFLGGARAPSGGARPRGSARAMRPTRTLHHGSRMPKEAPSAKPYRPDHVRPGGRLAPARSAGVQRAVWPSPGRPTRSRLAEPCRHDPGRRAAGARFQRASVERRARRGAQSTGHPCTVHSAQTLRPRRITPSGSTSSGNGPHLQPRQCKCRSGGPG